MSRLILPILLASLAVPAAAQTVTPNDLRAHVAVLASDDYGGRAPDSEGGRKTVLYVATQLSAAGLMPGAADHRWYQPVDLIAHRSLSGTAQFKRPDGTAIEIAEHALLMSGRDAAARLPGVPLVFTGYGIAPGAEPPDLTGRLALMLADHPPGDDRDLAGRAAALAAAGAAGVLLVFAENDPVDRLRESWRRKTTELASKDAARPQFYGGISDHAARRLFAATGDTLAEARLRAEDNPALVEPLALTADLAARSEIERLSSFNVVGKLAGRDPAAGAVMFLAHWDHLGLCRPEGAPDRICNGAAENASGVAVLIETARRLASGPALDRDVYFLATTAEELGLLGACAFIADPPLPLADIVAAFNLDTVAIAPAGAPLAIIGRGKTPIADDIASVARSIGRTIDPDDDANAFIKRQDGWALLERGVPAVMANGGFSDSERLQRFLGSDYHGPGDELTADMDLTGAAEDADLHVALGRYFGDATRYPGRTAK